MSRGRLLRITGSLISTTLLVWVISLGFTMLPPFHFGRDSALLYGTFMLIFWLPHILGIFCWICRFGKARFFAGSVLAIGLGAILNAAVLFAMTPRQRVEVFDDGVTVWHGAPETHTFFTVEHLYSVLFVGVTSVLVSYCMAFVVFRIDKR